jgi:serine/threonine-protein kinase
LWSADGQRLIFFSTRLGPRNLFTRSADGTGDAERLTTSPSEQWPTDVSRDGTILVFTEGAQGTGADVMQLALDGTGRITPLVQSRAGERNGALSPDGRWLAYDSDDSGQFEVYVLPFPALDRGRLKVSPAGGTQPVWGPAGRELFYVATSGAVMSVMLERDLSRVHAPMQVVKEGYETQTSAGYDVDLDGQRFLMLKAAPQSDQRMTNARLIVVENLFEELKRLLPVE